MEWFIKEEATKGSNLGSKKKEKEVKIKVSKIDLIYRIYDRDILL